MNYNLIVLSILLSTETYKSPNSILSVKHTIRLEEMEGFLFNSLMKVCTMKLVMFML